MYSLPNKFNGSALAGCAALAAGLMLASTSQATTFTLGGDVGQRYTYGSTTIPAGPYPGQLTGDGASNALLYYCLDENLTAVYGTSYTGTVHTPNTVAEDEVAFLAAYSLTHGSPGNVAVDGAISMAIWQIMGTLGIPTDPAAAQYLTLAQNAYANGQITAAFLANFQVFVPTQGGVQRFITVVATQVPGGQQNTPEPATYVLFGAGLMGIGIGKRLRKGKV
jgi:hypothetical protein